VIDLGIHLVDLALWTLDFPRVTNVSGRLFAHGRPLAQPPDTVEDYAVATFEFGNGGVARLACSWNLSAGRDAVVEARFHGTRGGAALSNVDGSFYDFIAERYAGTERSTLAFPPDDWGGRAAATWSARLAQGEGFDPDAARLIDVARVLDGIYGR
jgi:predicted dehydrogenase